ncbi:MAG: VWA domain-containing protein [Puniceicoccales bacterium]|jgi:Ca-activated chloride channel family protein|nr:VWA domain-containing protein [Puniceicoccales bacterium]
MKFQSSYVLIFGILYVTLLYIVALLVQRKTNKLLRRWSQQKCFPIQYAHRIVYTISRWILLLGLVALFVALARPQWGEVIEKRPQTGLNVLFAIDTSKSMLANDVRPNRLDLAKLSIEELLKSLQGNQVGLIAFAGNAFLQCPTTADHGAFKLSLRALDTNVIPRGGTNLSEAIQLAIRTFDTNTSYKQLILLTDGENLAGDVMQTAKEASRNGVVIHTVGIGSEKGTSIGIKNERGITEYLKDDQGKIVITRLDENTLKQIAQTTQGFYVPLGNAGEGLQQIYNVALKHLPKENFDSEERIPIERFHRFAGLAFLLLLLEPCLFFRKEKMRF